MNWDSFKDFVSHLCLAGAVVASWSLTQEVAGSNTFTIMKSILVTEFGEFNESFRFSLHQESASTLRQLCDDAYNFVLIEISGVAPEWFCNPFSSDCFQ